MSNMIAVGVYFFVALFIIAIFLAVREGRSRIRHSGLFMILCGILLLWVLSDIAEMLITSVSLNIFVWNLGLVPSGFVTAILLLLMFRFFYPNTKLPGFAKILFFTIPVLSVFVALTSNFHPFIRYTDSLIVWPREITYTRGFWFYVHTAGGMLNTLAGIAVLVKACSKKINNRAVVLFSACILVMLLGVLLNVFGVGLMNIDPASVSSGLALIFIYIAFTDGSTSILSRVLNTMKSRITFPVVMAVFVLIVVSVLYSGRTTRIMAEDSHKDRAAEATRAVLAYLEAREIKTLVAATALGDSAELIRRIHAGDRPEIWQYVADRQDFWGVDAIIVGCADGITLARSHLRDSYGDDITGVPSVAAGLRGEQITLYTPTPTAPIVMTSTSPIMDGDTLVGSVVVNFDVGMDFMLDHLKDTFGVDAMVFRLDGEGGGISASSTIIHPDTGERTIDSPAEPAIAEAVLGRGETVSGEMEMFGIPFHAYFFPLPGVDGRPNGMLFLGLSNEESLAIIGSMQRNMMMINLSGLTLAAVFMFFMIYRNIKPLSGLSATLKEVAAGNFSLNTDRSKISTDEIGEITHDIIDFVEVIKSMVEDLSVVRQIYSVEGNSKYRIDADKYQNSFREMIVSVNAIFDEEVANIMSTVSSLNQISDGDFDIKVNELDGDWKVQPDAFRRLIANLKGVSAGVNGMIEAASVKGDLSFKIDSSKYDGSWREIMEGLNGIAAAVDAPLNEIRDAMTELARGEFTNTKVTGDYKGDFLSMREAVNGMISTFNDYMDEVAQVLDDISKGNLTRRISREYIGEFNLLKNSINSITTKLNSTLSEISTAADQVLSGAKQIADSATNLADGANKQASSVQELNASVDLISQQTKQNADNAGEANTLSGKSTENAKEGNEAMEQMLEAMAGIKEASGNISRIISTIQDIAFQTNLLALNASVEAARAGEHGTGFSVVADEVRTLAGRSQKAAEESTGLIEDSIKRVDIGSGIAETTAKALNVIMSNADEVLHIINSISTSSREQAEAVEQVSVGLSEISKVVQSNSAVSEETAAASEELNSQAELLRQLVGYFKL